MENKIKEFLDEKEICTFGSADSISRSNVEMVIDEQMVEMHLATLGKREKIKVRESSFKTATFEELGIKSPNV